MNLSKQASSGIKWVSVSQFGKQVVQYLATIVLVSLLEPADFGLIAMAMVVIGFLEIFKDLGTASAIIHLEDISEEFLSSIFFVNIFFGMMISTLLIIFSPLISEFYNNDRLNDILSVLAISFLISSFSIVQKSLLEKGLNFSKISSIEIISAIIGAATGLVLAIYGFGVWSLVFQTLINNLTLSFSLWIACRWKPSLKFNLNSILSILKYSSNLVGYNIINYIVRNIDYLLIGKFLGEKDLGHYFIAYKIMLYPVSNISMIISRVMFPIYSKIKFELSKFRVIYIKVGNSISLITFPLMMVLFINNDLIANIFFSNKWNPDLISSLILILAPVGLIQSIASTTGSIYRAIGKTNWMFYWGIFSGIIYISGFIIGINYGVIGISVSYLVTTCMLSYPVFAIPFRIIKLKVGTFIQSFSRVIIAVVVMSFFLFLFRFYLIGNINIILQLTISIGVALSFYTITLLLIYKNQIIEILTILKK